MSQSSLPKNSPDFLRQENLDQALKLLRQPFSLAILASLGVHALLGVTLPMLPAAKPKEPNPESVKVVELSPAQQARIPELASPQANFPSTINPGKLPSSTSKPPNIKTPSVLDDYNIPQILTPPPFDFSSIAAPPSTVLPPSKRVSPQQPKPQQATNPNPPVPPKPSTSNPGGNNAAQANTNQQAPATQPPLTNEERNQRLLAQGQEALKARNLFTFNATNTTQAEFNKNASQLSDYAKSASKGNLALDWQRQKEVTTVYPKEACPFRVKSTAWIGAFVKPDGKIDKLEPILSSGYKGLDNAALEYISNQKIAPTGQYQAMIFPFKFEPSASACPPTNGSQPPA